MKKLISLSLLLLFIVSLVSVNAQEITTDAVLEQEAEDIADETANDPELEDEGTTPDKAGYGLKIALEKIRLGLTFNRARKAELALQLAELRVKEARLMAAGNKLEALQRAKDEHRKYIELSEKHIERINNKNALKDETKLEIKLKEQKNQVDELESLILVKAKNLSPEQRDKLLALIEEFRASNQNVELKLVNKKDIIKTRLRARGTSEQEIDDEIKEGNKTEETKGDLLERKATHQIGQAEKMYNLASKLIEKAQSGVIPGNETNQTSNKTRKVFTISARTLELHAKAKTELDQAKAELAAKQYFKAIENARDSKKLSTLTIATIHGGVNQKALENRLDKIEEDMIKKGFGNETNFTSMEKRRKLEEKVREKLDERRGRESEDDDDEDDKDDDVNQSNSTLS